MLHATAFPTLMHVHAMSRLLMHTPVTEAFQRQRKEGEGEGQEAFKSQVRASQDRIRALFSVFLFQASHRHA